ncbi:MAG TPA: hypothetical protein VMZ53_00965 [Kofleriaceae bacterium]|nr:hypothetical protein [Kofleriaceae bacterium]
MRSFLAIAAFGLASGCIYVDPINQRPSLDIEREGGGEVFRGDEVRMRALANDPENQLVFFQWRAYACSDATEDESGARPGCDAVPFYTEILQDAKLTVPSMRADVTEPPQQLLVLLEGQDDFGATAKPIQRLVLAVSDRSPDLALRKDSRYGYVVNTAVNIYAKLGDGDDGPLAALPLEWKVYTPMTQPGYDLVDIDVKQDPMDTKHVQLGKAFTPKGVGDWEIEVTAMDQLQRACVAEGRDDCTKTVERVMITVVPDHAPCLSQLSPLVAAAPNALPVSDPTLFQVNVVLDDLDPFPGVPSDAVLGTPAFHWSISTNDFATHQDLTTTGNALAFDPASYSPGDIVEVRVEIQDRKNTAVTCADNLATCSTISDNSCIQRQTWRVEVR